MAIELELLLRFERPEDVPTKDDLENDLDCIELSRNEEEV